MVPIRLAAAAIIAVLLSGPDAGSGAAPLPVAPTPVVSGIGVAVPAESPDAAARLEAPRALTFDTWRGTTPITIATAGEAQAALIAAGMDWRNAERLADALADCEAPVREVVTGRSIGINLLERGDDGLAHGGFAIRVDWHPELAARYDLDTLEGGAAASVEIAEESVRMGRAALWPWVCAR